MAEVIDNDSIMNTLFKDYNLIYNKEDPKNSDVFITKNFKIITRSGIDKIEAACEISSRFELVKSSDFEVAMIGHFSHKNGKSVSTFGEASVDHITYVVTEASLEDGGTIRKKQEVQKVTLKEGNVRQNPPYLFAMAEKRARSRGVLRLAGLYDLGFYGEDEAETFGKATGNIVETKKVS